MNQSTPEILLLGIDFGNAYTSICTIGKDNLATVIADEDGHRLLPSVVTFIDKDAFLVGHEALSVAHKYTESTFTYFFDLLGATQEELKARGLVINNNIPSYKLNDQFISLYRVCELMLSHVKQCASSYLGTSKYECVISVPAKFSQSHIENLKKLAANVGLAIIDHIKDNISPILAYHENTNPSQHNETAMVIDFGASATKYTLVSISNGIISILNSLTNSEINAHKIDGLLFDHIKKEFTKKTKLQINNKKQEIKLIQACDATKKNLSKASSGICFIESIADGMDLSVTITRSRFDMLITKTINNITKDVHELLSSQNINIELIDSIYLVGGMAKIPRIKKKIEAVFTSNSKAPKFRDTIETDEAVCIGCVLHAKILKSAFLVENLNIVKDAKPHLIQPHTNQHIVIKQKNGEVVPLIKKGSMIPNRYTFNLKNALKDSVIEIFEGEQLPITKNVKTQESDDNNDGPTSTYQIIEYEWTTTRKLAQTQVSNTPSKLIIDIDSSANLKVKTGKILNA